MFVVLQMGMGKTACAVGAIQKNPPPPGWRANRSYQKLRRRDHLCERPGSRRRTRRPSGTSALACWPCLLRTFLF
jgi:hypothetical protein